MFSGPIYVFVVVCELGRFILAGLCCVITMPGLICFTSSVIVLWCWSGLVHSSGNVMRESGSTQAFQDLDSKLNITSSIFY